MRLFRNRFFKPNFYFEWNINFLHLKEYSTSYKNTLLLPKTNFPHKISPANRRDRDRKIEADAQFDRLYQLQRSRNATKEFILHDGPPYANGDVHIGHAVNKILKDITVRFELSNGNKVHYVPGWDCHGLPIELKVLKENVSVGSLADKLDVRTKAYSFSQKTKKTQMESFKQWGILADWEDSYYTCDKDYIVQQLLVFQELYEKGIIYRDHKPVFWSPHNRTSLAEAELEYNATHVSPSVFLKLHVNKQPDFLKHKLSDNIKLYAVIWTTTPWTLPANQAVCYSSDEKYCVVYCKSRKEYYIIADKMVHSLQNALKTEVEIIESFESSLLSHVMYLHPVQKNRECPLLPAHHVTMDKGTGLVHMAPNHGLEDYSAAKFHKLRIDACLVDEDGCYNSLAGEDLEGKKVLDSGNAHILNSLAEDILVLEDYSHSYPYDWRSKTPVILRSCFQWFVDVEQIREKAIECLQKVKIVPSHFKKVFENQLQTSPQWCISRQRTWGVPIPAFYSSKDNTPFVHRSLTEHLCSLIKEKGINCWWQMEAKDLIPGDLIRKKELEDFQKGVDIMDIWFDSGISWKCVLPDPHISDVCIEGIDQIRGWFNSSLLTSVALRGNAPYRSLVLHGFTTDADGKKMSKSEGNIIRPDDIISGSKKGKLPPYGIDTLRWWIAAHACQSENIAVKPNTLDECAQNLNKVRNVFKFLLGNLHGYNPTKHLIPAAGLCQLDLYTLHLLLQFSEKIQAQYSSIQYKNVAKEILNFVANDVSSFYCHLVKDRLYCESQESVERLGCQTVLYFILNTLIQTISPICPHLAGEVWLHHSHSELAKQNAFFSEWPSLQEFLKDTISPKSFDWAIQIRDIILKSEAKTTDMKIYISCDKKIEKVLEELNTNSINNTGLTEFFQASSVCFEKSEGLNTEQIVLEGTMREVSDGHFTVTLTKTDLKKCPRCRLNVSAADNSLCNRCAVVTNSCVSQQIINN